MPENESIHDRITQLVNKFGEGKNTVFASIIGSSEANVRGYRASVMPKYDFLEKIARNFDIDLNWLLTGRGSMLRSDGATDPHNTPIVDTSSNSNIHSDAVTLRLMDKLDEKDNIIKEKETKIEQLQAELREKSEELVALKAFHQHIHIRGYHDQPDIEGTRKGLGQ